MAIRYGALRGQPDRYQREDGGKTPHLQIRVLDATGQPWRIAVNVESDDGSEVVYWVVDPLAGAPILAGLDALATGFSTQPADAAHALDFTKAPLFDLAQGRLLPPSGQGGADDLQDLLSAQLDRCKAAGGEIVAFGAKFTSDEHLPIDTQFGNTDGLHGVHDIHMNQGNRGSFASDNAAFHDGGLILRFPDRAVGIFLAFQTQCVPTDAHGSPTEDARPLSDLINHAGG